MVGITLSPEQIRSAPPQVREWIEHEIAHALGLTASAPQPPQVPPHLVACGHDEVKAILAEIRSMLPVVAVFFELGREFGQQNGARGASAAHRIHPVAQSAPHARASCAMPGCDQ